MTKSINVLSLFDGMSCSQIALKNLGIKVDRYYASEIDKYGIQIAQKNFPDTIQLGDVKDIKGKDLPEIDLIVGGSPCQGFSFAGKQLAFDDPRSVLFFEFVRLLKEIKPKYFLLENVVMRKEFQQVITDEIRKIYPQSSNGNLFGIEPIMINSALLSAQNRKRLYWTNIPNIEQPEDLGIVLRDVLDYEPEEFTKMSDNFLKRNDDEGKPKHKAVKNTERNLKHTKMPNQKSLTLTATMYKGAGNNGMTLVPLETYNTPKNVNKPETITIDKEKKQLTIKEATKKGYTTIEDGDCFDMTYPNSKTRRGRNMKDKSNCLTSANYDYMRYEHSEENKEVYWRKLTCLECERLQTVPDNYTEGVSNTQRYKMLGNGFTVKVIEHILKNMEL